MRTISSLIAAIAFIAPVTVHANPNDIGMTSATKNEVIVFSGADRRGLKIGDRIFQEQNIRTGADSAAQLLFIDETALTVGPNSSLVLDKSVFDPDKRVGELSVRALSGAFRFISGSSPSTNYTVKTPAGTIGVRGTWFVLRIQGDTIEILVRSGAVRFCNEVQQCQRVNAGFMIRANRNNVTAPVRAKHETLESMMQLWFGSGATDLANLAPGAGPIDDQAFNDSNTANNNQFWWQTTRDFQPDRSAQGSFVANSEPGAQPPTAEPDPKGRKFKRIGWLILHATLEHVRHLIQSKVDDPEAQREIRRDLRPQLRELRREIKQVDTRQELKDFVRDVKEFKKDAKQAIGEHAGQRNYREIRLDGRKGYRREDLNQHGHKTFKQPGPGERRPKN